MGMEEIKTKISAKRSTTMSSLRTQFHTYRKQGKICVMLETLLNNYNLLKICI